MKFTSIILGASAALFMTGAAYAGPVDPLLVNGLNVLEDISGEMVYQCDASNSCAPATAGTQINFETAQDGSYFVLAGILDYSELINGQSPISANVQLSGIFATRLDSLGGDFGNISNQTAVGADVFNQIFGVDLNSLALDEGSTDDVIGVFYQDNGTAAFDALQDSGFAAAVAATTAGQLAAVAGLVDDDDFFQAALTGPNSSIVGGGAAGNQDVLANIAFGLSFQSYQLSGDFVEDGVTVGNLITGGQVAADISGTGTATKPVGQGVHSSFHFGDDIQSQFVRVPEPATLGLLGVGLLGIGALARRRRG